MISNKSWTPSRIHAMNAIQMRDHNSDATVCMQATEINIATVCSR